MLSASLTLDIKRAIQEIRKVIGEIPILASEQVGFGWTIKHEAHALMLSAC
jgi:hypothetical protein